MLLADKLTHLNKISNISINVTLRRVRETIVAVEKQLVLHVLECDLQPYLSIMQSA
jgi:hypothetical protein